MSGTETTTVDVGVSDADLFEGAIAADAPAEQPVTEVQPEAEQPRNPDGTFATKEAAPEPEKPVTEPEAKPAPVAEAADDKDTGGQIPSWRLREEREAKAEAIKRAEAAEAERSKLANDFAQMQREFAELRKPAPKPEEKPDPLLDPQGFEAYLERKFEDRILGERREYSLRSAHRTHGDKFSEAYAEASQAMARGDRALQARMQASPDPGETLVQWHQEQKTMKEVGNDPAAYKTRLLDEALKDPAYLAKAIAAANAQAGSPNNGARPAVRLPPSLSGAARADAHETNPSDNDVSDEGLFRHATAGMR